MRSGKEIVVTSGCIRSISSVHAFTSQPHPGANVCSFTTSLFTFLSSERAGDGGPSCKHWDQQPAHCCCGKLLWGFWTALSCAGKGPARGRDFNQRMPQETKASHILPFQWHPRLWQHSHQQKEVQFPAHHSPWRCHFGDTARHFTDEEPLDD